METPSINVRVALQDMTDEEALYVAARINQAVSKINTAAISKHAHATLLFRGTSDIEPIGLLADA